MCRVGVVICVCPEDLERGSAVGTCTDDGGGDSSVGWWEAAIFGCIGLANLSGFAME